MFIKFVKLGIGYLVSRCLSKKKQVFTDLRKGRGGR